MDIIKVTWIDSSGQSDWLKTKDLNYELSVIVSVGMVIKEDEDKLLISMNYFDIEANDCAEVSDSMLIPRCCIKKIEVLQSPTDIPEKLIIPTVWFEPPNSGEFNNDDNATLTIP